MRNCPQQPLPEPHSKIPTAISGAAKKSALRWRSQAHHHPKVLPPSKAVDQHPVKSTLQPWKYKEFWVFYNFYYYTN